MSVSDVSMADQPSIPALTILAHREGSTAILLLSGDLDLVTAVALEREADAALDSGPDALALDLAGIGFFGVAGYHAVARVAERAEARGCRLELRSPSPAVRRVLDLLSAPGGPPAG